MTESVEPRPSASNFWPLRLTFVIAPTVRRVPLAI
jgi:hypothetical protein